MKVMMIPHWLNIQGHQESGLQNTPVSGTIHLPHARLRGRIFNWRRWFDLLVSDAQRICAKCSLLHGLAPSRACGNHGNVIESILHHGTMCFVQTTKIDFLQRIVSALLGNRKTERQA